ncbi:unnamed protein product [Merluccius merluccius]
MSSSRTLGTCECAETSVLPASALCGGGGGGSCFQRGGYISAEMPVVWELLPGGASQRRRRRCQMCRFPPTDAVTRSSGPASPRSPRVASLALPSSPLARHHNITNVPLCDSRWPLKSKGVQLGCVSLAAGGGDGGGVRDGGTEAGLRTDISVPALTVLCSGGPRAVITRLEQQGDN